MNRYLELKITETPYYYRIIIKKQSHRGEDFYPPTGQFKLKNFKLVSLMFPEIGKDRRVLFVRGSRTDMDDVDLYLDKDEDDSMDYIDLLNNAVWEYNNDENKLERILIKRIEYEQRKVRNKNRKN